MFKIPNRSLKFTLMLCLLGCSLLPAIPSAATQLAGKVQFAVGEVIAKAANGKTRMLKKGDFIYTGETITTDDESSAQLIFTDRSRIAVRVNTEFKIDRYEFDKKMKTGKSNVSLVRGALRAVTGLIGAENKSNVEIKTPVVTIGIRGTDHEVAHITGVMNKKQFIAKVGTYNKVYSGATTVTTNDGLVLKLDVNDVGFIGWKDKKIFKPVKIDVLPGGIEKLLVKKVPLIARPQGRPTLKSAVIKQGALAPIDSKTTLNSTQLNTGVLSPTTSTTIKSTTLSPTTTTVTNKLITPTTTISPTSTIQPTTTITPTTTIEPTTTISPIYYYTK